MIHVNMHFEHKNNYLHEEIYILDIYVVIQLIKMNFLILHMKQNLRRNNNRKTKTETIFGSKRKLLEILYQFRYSFSFVEYSV